MYRDDVHLAGCAMFPTADAFTGLLEELGNDVHLAGGPEEIDVEPITVLVKAIKFLAFWAFFEAFPAYRASNDPNGWRVRPQINESMPDSPHDPEPVIPRFFCHRIKATLRNLTVFLDLVAQPRKGYGVKAF